MELKDYLNSINFTKENVIQTSDSKGAAEKLYPSFVVNRSMSYFPECIFYANALNLAGNIDKVQHYEFLLYSIPKGKRFSKWGKVEKDEEVVSLIMNKYGYSRKRAKEVLPLMSKENIDDLINSYKMS